MTARKRKGVGFLISAGVFAGLGGVFLTMDVTPDWVTLAVNVIGYLAGALGFVVVYPDTEE